MIEIDGNEKVGLKLCPSHFLSDQPYIAAGTQYACLQGMISLRTHNILDYVIGAILVLSPYVFGFSDINAARNVFLVLGFGLIGYSMLTKYYYSVAKLIPIKVHMVFDVTAGIILLLAPGIFNYGTMLTGGQVALHYVMGLGAILLVAVTRGIGRSSIADRDMNREDERPVRRVA